MMLDSIGVIQRINHVTKKLFNVTEADMIGHSFAEFTMPITEEKLSPHKHEDRKNLFFTNFLRNRVGLDDTNLRVIVSIKSVTHVQMQLCVTEMQLSNRTRSFIACLTDIRDIVKKEEEVSRAQQSEFEMIKRVQEQRQHTDNILSAMMPEDIVKSLRRGDIIPPKAYENVTIFFR